MEKRFGISCKGSHSSNLLCVWSLCAEMCLFAHETGSTVEDGILVSYEEYELNGALYTRNIKEVNESEIKTDIILFGKVAKPFTQADPWTGRIVIDEKSLEKLKSNAEYENNHFPRILPFKSDESNFYEGSYVKFTLHELRGSGFYFAKDICITSPKQTLADSEDEKKSSNWEPTGADRKHPENMLTIVIGASRDGSALMAGFRLLRHIHPYVRKYLGRNEDDKSSSLFDGLLRNLPRLVGELGLDDEGDDQIWPQPASDRSGETYFARMDEHWSTISRADMPSISADDNDTVELSALVDRSLTGGDEFDFSDPAIPEVSVQRPINDQKLLARLAEHKEELQQSLADMPSISADDNDTVELSALVDRSLTGDDEFDFSDPAIPEVPMQLDPILRSKLAKRMEKQLQRRLAEKVKLNLESNVEVEENFQGFLQAYNAHISRWKALLNPSDTLALGAIEDMELLTQRAKRLELIIVFKESCGCSYRKGMYYRYGQNFLRNAVFAPSRWKAAGEEQLGRFLAQHEAHTAQFEQLLQDWEEQSSSLSAGTALVLSGAAYRAALAEDILLRDAHKVRTLLEEAVFDAFTCCRNQFFHVGLYVEPPAVETPVLVTANPATATATERCHWEVVTEPSKQTGKQLAVVCAALSSGGSRGRCFTMLPSDSCSVSFDFAGLEAVVTCCHSRETLRSKVRLPASFRSISGSDATATLQLQLQRDQSLAGAVSPQSKSGELFVWLRRPWRRFSLPGLLPLKPRALAVLTPPLSDTPQHRESVWCPPPSSPHGKREWIQLLFRTDYYLETLVNTFPNAPPPRAEKLTPRKRLWSAPDAVHSSDFEAAAHMLHYGQDAELRSLLKTHPTLAVERSQYQESLLEFACSLNRADVAQELLELQTDPTSANQWDTTPLAVAIAAGAVETVEVLLQYGASLTQRDRAGRDALIWAAERGNARTVELLLDRGAKPAVFDKRGETALLCAVLRSVRLFRTAPDCAARQIEAEQVLRLLEAAEGVPRLTEVAFSTREENCSDAKFKLHYERIVRNIVKTTRKLTAGLTAAVRAEDHLSCVLLVRAIAQHAQKPVALTLKFTQQLPAELVTAVSLMKLKGLYINGLKKEDPTALRAVLGAIPTHSPLRLLGLQGTKCVSTLGEELGRLLRRSASLQQLDLRGTGINDAALLAVFQVLEHNQTLHTLHLGGNSAALVDYTAEVCSGLVSLLKANSSIKTLSLKLCTIGISCKTDLIDELSTNQNITALDLYRANLTDDDIAAILEHNTVLESITLYKYPYNNSSRIAKALKSNPSFALKQLVGFEFCDEECRHVLELDYNFGSKSNAQILEYLRELRSQGKVEVKRVRLILVGNGNTGKSTLVKRLREDSFDETAAIMTDGIDISQVTLQGVDMTVFDFAGQSEYEHTHSLFFDDQAVFLLLYCPRSGGMDRLQAFLNMIQNCAPQAEIILVTTRCHEAVLDDIEREFIMALSPRIVACHAIDSKYGTGIPALVQSIVQVALDKPSTVKRIPRSFDNLQQQISEYGRSRFSITVSELEKLCSLRQLHISSAMRELALSLFLDWGYVHRLSNGDIVLRPQQLANVMACMFTKVESKQSRIGDVHEGVLRHTDKVLDAVWAEEFPDLDKHMWRCSVDRPISPFLQLLYQAGLAFELFDPSGKPVGASLVPALLPVLPAGLDRLPHHSPTPSFSSPVCSPETPAVAHMERLCKLLVPPELDVRAHGLLVLQFAKPLPGPFMGRLQVKLRRMATLGGSWRRGCCLVLKDVEASHKLTKDHKEPQAPNTASNLAKLSVESIVVVSEEGALTLLLQAAGPTTTARSAALSALLSLIAEDFPSVVIADVRLVFSSRVYNRFDLAENLSAGSIVQASTGLSVHISSLRPLFPEVAVKHKEVSHAPQSSVELLLAGDGECIFEQHCPLELLRPLAELEAKLCSAEKELAATDSCDAVFLSDQLLQCIPSVLHLLGLRHCRERGLSTLWVILADRKTSKQYAVPLSPTRVQGNVTWFPLVEDARVDLSGFEEYMCSPNSGGGAAVWHMQLCEIVSALLARCFAALFVPLTKRWAVSPLRDIGKLLPDLRHAEMRLFTSLDNVMLTKHYSDIAQCMVLSKQIKHLSQSSQAQERILVKIVQQKVEAVVVRVSADMQTGFRGIAQELSKGGNPAAVQEIQELWSKKMVELEALVQAGGDNSVARITNHMDKVEVMVSAKLFELDVSSGDVKVRLGEIKRQLVEASAARERGEERAEERLQVLVADLKTIHTQLDRVEDALTATLQSMQASFDSIRAELAENTEGWGEFQELWVSKIAAVEQVVAAGGEELAANVEQQFKKAEMMLSAKLFDLDVASEGLEKQLVDIKMQLLAVCEATQRGEASGTERMAAILAQLSGLGAQLDRVEAKVEKLFAGMEASFSVVRTQLQGNDAELQEVKKLWLSKLSDLERVVLAGPAADTLDKQMKKMEVILAAKLYELDVDNSGVVAQLAEVRTQLRDANNVRLAGDVHAEERLGRILVELRGMQTQLVAVLSLQKDSAAQLSQEMELMRKCVVNVNQRLCPTTFILFPNPAKDNPKANRDALARMKRVFEAVRHPREALVGVLHEKYRIALLCEVCKLPSDDQDLWYKVSKPKEIVGKILPLAQAGMTLMYVANKAATVASVFGIPVPVLQDETFAEGRQFLEALGRDSLEDFAQLQQRVQENYDDIGGRDARPQSAVVTTGQLGYCVREFARFLEEVDPQKKWANLSARATPDGDMCFACPSCCSK